jgi:hypothetical protein
MTERVHVGLIVNQLDKSRVTSPSVELIAKSV